MAPLSEFSSLQIIVHARFREVFGEPTMVQGHGEHWSLQPAGGGSRINIMVNGTRDGAAVWVFDPHDPKDGMASNRITRESEIDEVIDQVQRRLVNAVGTRTRRMLPPGSHESAH